MTAISADELYDFYAQLGQALHAVQGVEGTLHKVLAMRIDFAENRPTPESAAQTLESYRQETLGGLVQKAEKRSVFDAKVIALLRDLNADRRFVVHRLQEKTDEGLRNDPRFRREISRRLEEIADKAFYINRLLTTDLMQKEGRAFWNNPVFQEGLERELRSKGFL